MSKREKHSSTPSCFIRSSVAPTVPEVFRSLDVSAVQDALGGSWLQRTGCWLVEWTVAGKGRLHGSLRVELRPHGISYSGGLYDLTGTGVTPSSVDGVPQFPWKAFVAHLAIPTNSNLTAGVGAGDLVVEVQPMPGSWKDIGGVYHFHVLAPTTSASSQVQARVTRVGSTAQVGTLQGWYVSPFLRRATLEIDFLKGVKIPGANVFPGRSAVEAWADVFSPVHWDMRVKVADKPLSLSLPDDHSWTDAELHAIMGQFREKVNMERAWYYYLVCVGSIGQGDVLGLMFDTRSGGDNGVAREGAAVAAKFLFPPGSPLAGRKLQELPRVYFRTAVHELGHALAQVHEVGGGCFMQRTADLISAPEFSTNSALQFSAVNQAHLKHAADIIIRPSNFDFPGDVSQLPEIIHDAGIVTKAGKLSVLMQQRSFPLGAPWRIGVVMESGENDSLGLPSDLGLRGGHVSCTIVGPSGRMVHVRTRVPCEERHEANAFVAGVRREHWYTLLFGHEGPIAVQPGIHCIEFHVDAELDGRRVTLAASSHVMVHGPATQRHAEASLAVLDAPQIGTLMVVGGKHLEGAVDAIGVAIADPTLAPHFSVLEVCRLLRLRELDSISRRRLVALLSKKTIGTPSESAKLARLAATHPDLSTTLKTRLTRWVRATTKR